MSVVFRPSGPLRVVHVVHSLGTGGMENGVVNVARELERTGEARVSVICLTTAGPMAGRLPRAGSVVALGKPEGRQPWWAWRLARAVRKLGGADVLHTHNLGPLIYTGLARWVGLRVPILHGEHAALTAAECAPAELRRRRRLYRRVSLLHTVSHDMTRQLQELGLPAGEVRTILNGVDLARFCPAAESARDRLPPSWPADAWVVLMVARFGEYKGHERLLAAWPDVVRAFPRARLVLVGSGGPREAAVRQWLDSAPARELVHWAGHQGDPVPWYRAANLLILPSTNEGLSNVTLEAMACGCPVLTHPSAGASEIVHAGADGWVAPLDTVDAITRHLGEVLAAGPDQLRAVGERARETVASRWSLARMVDGYRDAYAFCLRDRHTP